MRVSLWGTRGSLATPDPQTVRFGGNTSCVEVRGPGGHVLVLDAGTGIRRLGRALVSEVERVDILLTHLHMDHIQGLGFFAPMFAPGIEVHVWGPGRAGYSLEARISRYLSPPLFPVHLRDIGPRIQLHTLGQSEEEIGPFHITTDYVCHPNPTIGYRIEVGGHVVAYIPDHEPALGSGAVDLPPQWTSGWRLSAGSDLLIHDAQYTDEEYPSHTGWGHSSIEQACAFAALCDVTTLVPFHHDPSHDDRQLEAMLDSAVRLAAGKFEVRAGMEGRTFQIGPEDPLL